MSAIAFGDFVEHLRRHGFVVGLDHYARMMTVLERLGPESSPTQLKTMLCPLFATTAERQSRFYQEFDRFYPLFVEEGVSGRVDTVAEEEAAGATGGRRWNRQYTWLAGAAIAATLVLGIWIATRPAPAPLPTDLPTLPSAPLPDQPAPRPAPVAPTGPVESPSFLEQHRTAIRIGGIALIALVFVGWEWITYRRRRVVLERQRRARPPLVWPVRVDRVASPFVETPDFYMAARRLRDREAGERQTLDVNGTIAATVRALGFPTFRYAAVTRPPEYLVLIERSSRGDHQASLYAQLARDLAAEGVHVVQYFYDDDPRACTPVDGGPAVMLSELRRKHSAHRVLVFGTGEGFIDPITGALASWAADGLGWSDRVLLTPATTTRWGTREFTLASLFVVLPATVGGLLAAVDRIQDAERPVRRRSARVAGGEFRADLSDATWVDDLREHLGGAAFQWVCACAVYPELQWRLTLFLGTLPELGARALNEESVLKVARLPWFRAGVIPDEARQALIRQLSPAAERAVRMALIDLLERNPAPAESIASSGYELDLVVQKLVVDGANRRRRRELLRAVRYAPRDRAARELAVLRLAEGEPSSRLAMRLPGRLRNVFFRRGLAVFGLTSGARAALMLLAQASLLVAVGRSAEQPISPVDPSPTPNVQQVGQSASPAGAKPDSTAGAPTRLANAAGSRARADSAVSMLRESPRVLLDRAIGFYETFNLEGALPILRDLVTPGRHPLTKAERTQAETYLGAAFAVFNQSDSAIAHFRAALTLQPDLTLDPSRFSRVEVGTLAAAKRLMVAEATPLPFPGGVQENLNRAKELFNSLEIERARDVLRQLLFTDRIVSEPQRVEMYKYMGAIHALMPAGGDSARAYFVAAIDYDPFVELDPSVFAADEQAAFARARFSIFKVGVRLTEPALAWRLPVGSPPVPFRIVTTQAASVRVELRSVGDNKLQEILFTASASNGVRDIPWSGLINAAPADSDRYFLRVVATNAAGRSDSSTVSFNALCRSSSGAPSCALGSVDFATLRGRLDAPAPAPAVPPSVDSLLRQALLAFNNRNYPRALTVAREVIRAQGTTPQQRARGFEISAAAFYPEEKASQQLGLAVSMINAWARLAGPNPVFDRQLTWAGLDSLIAGELRPSTGPRRPTTELVAISNLTNQFTGEWRTPGKVADVEFPTNAMLTAFTTHLANNRTRVASVSPQFEVQRGDTVNYLATAQFDWSDATGRARRKTVRVRWVFVCQSGSNPACEIKRVIFLDPVP